MMSFLKLERMIKLKSDIFVCIKIKFMNKLLHQFFTQDHRRIEEILERAIKDPTNIDMDIYYQFRTGLLTHIKMEEKILFPAAQKGNNGVALPIAAQLRLDHGALTALMTIPPTAEVLKVLNYILEKHDVLEEEPGGMYDACEALTQNQTQEILEELTKVTPVPMHPVNNSTFVFGAAKRALERAGYDYDELVRL